MASSVTGVVENCYNTGGTESRISSSTGKSDYANKGILAESGTAINCYDLGSESIGGNATDCYYSVTGNPDNITSFFAENMQKQSIYVGFDFENIWYITDKGNYSYPQLRSYNKSTSDFFEDGNGTAENPYQITNKYQLDAVRNDLDAYYILMNDIEFTEADFAEGGDFEGGFTPIGSKDNPLAGVFDGNGKTISNLKYDSGWNAYIFRYLSENATVKNLTISAGVF